MTSASLSPFDISLEYLAPGSNNAVVIPSTGGGDKSIHQGEYRHYRVPMHNGRQRQFDLDHEGFELLRHQTRITDFYDDESLKTIYESEIRDLLLEVTAARDVEIFDHTRRAASLQVQRVHGIREPATTIHNDYSADSGPQRLREVFADDPERLHVWLQRRFAIVNVWRSVAGTIHNFPLAVCDASSVATTDLVAVERQAKGRVGEIQFAHHNPTHQWYYFPQMQMDEAIAFKVYDSADDGRSRFTIHTSFDDPTAKSGMPARESIETRCFVFF